MDFNLLFSVLLYMLIGVLLLLSLRTFITTKYHVKESQENYMNMQQQLESEKWKQELVIQKNAYLENYNLELFNKIFEITKELLLTKKIIFEERYN